MRLILSVLVLMAMSTSVFAETPDSTAATSADSASMKFDFVNDSLIVIAVYVNDSGPYKFLLDTGAGITVLSTELAKKLKIPSGRPRSLDSAAGAVAIDVRPLESLRIGDIRIKRPEVAVGDFELMRSLDVDGILGGDRLKSFNVAIEYSKQRLRLERA